MKLSKIAVSVILLSMFLGLPACAANAPDISAASAILVDGETGRTLWEKNADEPRLIASTTKIMTALIALERLDPDRTVIAAPEWTGIEGSTMYLAPGQELTVRDLLYGLMLASGNDAAVALACITAGSVEDFAVLMNEKAAALGCENTHFENPNGLDGETHYSSARDLAVIAREAIQNEQFRRIVSTETASVGSLTYTNHNRLLRECEGVFGVKTGYTEAAGRTLVSCCEREGRVLICVTLADPDDWADHKALYDWAFEEYSPMETLSAAASWSVPVIGGNEEAVEVSASEPLTAFCREGESITVTVQLPAFVYADVSSGDTAGQATAFVDGVAVNSVPLVYGQDVSRAEEEKPISWKSILQIIGLGERKIYALT